MSEFFSRLDFPVEADKRTDNLHICPVEYCRSEMVEPVEWSELKDGSFEVLCRCPNCEWHGRGQHCKDTLDKFDDQLEDGCEELLTDLEQLVEENKQHEQIIFCAEIEDFIKALYGNQILPEDVAGVSSL